MGGLSIWHILAFAAIAFVLFGSSFKFSDMMGDVAKGIKSFKKGMSDDDVAKPADVVNTLDGKTLDGKTAAGIDKVSEASKSS